MRKRQMKKILHQFFQKMGMQELKQRLQYQKHYLNQFGRDNKCDINALKNYGKTTTKAKALINKIDRFKKETKKEVELKDYFKGNASSIVYNIFVNINYILSLCLATQDILCVPEQELKSIQIVEVCNKVQYEYGKENKRKKEF